MINELRLPIARYRLLYTADERVDLPQYAGSAWRGALGHALRRTVCVTNMKNCADCLLFRSCAYPYAFETPPAPNAEKMRKYNAAPHPFVLDVEPGSRRLAAGESIEVGLVLIGRANDLLPFFVHALGTAGRTGLGRGKGRLTLTSVWQRPSLEQEDWTEIYRGEGNLNALPASVPSMPPFIPNGVLKLSVHTPLRFRSEGAFVSPDRMEFGALFSNLLRRVSMLSSFHTPEPLEVDFKGLTAAAREVPTLRKNLRWYDWTRYSNRQQKTMQMGGLLGDLYVPTGPLEPFWSFLWLGTHIHAGTATSMGLGRYSITPLASLPPLQSEEKTPTLPSNSQSTEYSCA